MDFTFTDDQLLFRDTVRDFLRREITTGSIRELWQSDTGRSPELWEQFTQLGLTGMTVPEAQGGLGMDAVDFVLLAEECGYVALPEPLVHNALVAVPLLQSIGGDLAADWLPRVATGEARVVAGLESNGWVEDAHIADLLLLQRGTSLHAVTADRVSLVREESIDPSRRLFSVEIRESSPVDVEAGWLAKLRNRGALACAAQALGLAQRMIELSVAYTSERKQFGKPIGSFQAVKHHLADVAVRLEYARAPVYRAANSVALDVADADVHVSHAKLVACEAANLAAKNSIQVHGAMGYTWEVDLHIFMKRAWALTNAWGDAGVHKQRIADRIFSDKAELGAARTFYCEQAGQE